MDKLIVRPLKESGISTVIVIDALDECRDQQPTSAILAALGQLVSKIPKVKFFVTGRPDPQILEDFHRPLLESVSDMFVLHEVEPSQVADDIRLFFRQHFLELADRRGGLDNWPSEEHLDLLCERAAGLFVYAVATLKFIDHKNVCPRVQLDLILRSPKNSAYEGETRIGPNTTLDSLYMSILQEAFGCDSTRNDSRVRSVPGALVLVANPLSPSAIAALLDIDSTGAFRKLSLIHSLLILQGSDRPTQPFHKSFSDFIVDPTRFPNERFRVSPSSHHSELLVGCLNLMNRTLEKNMCNLPEAVINSEINDLQERIERQLCPALRYACVSWHKHADEHTIRAPEVLPALRCS